MTADGGGKLADKTALITGAANGIGRAIAQRFAKEGAAVLVADVALDQAETVANGIRQSGGRAEACACDVSDTDAAKAAIDQAVASFGGLHIVVGGAAVFSPITSIDQLSEADWQRALDVNITGCFLICKHAIPHLKAAGGGTIILIASQMAQVANAGQTVYCATKGALVQLAKGMALDHAGDNIRVNTLSPGGIATDRLVKRFGDMEQAQKIWGAKHPMGRLGEPDEMARGAVFLASEDSAFMTGADLLLDGGYTAW